jgi:predicted ATPase
VFSLRGFYGCREFPDQATRAAHSSVEDARAANHKISLCVALAHAACPLALLTGDLAAAEHYGTMLLDHSTRHALALWRACGPSFQGLLVIQRGDVITGLRLLRAGFDEFGEAGSVVSRLVAFQMAEALGRAGQNAEGLAAIEEAIARSERSAMAELMRVKGELLLLQGAPGAAAAAEDHFRQALDWARRQGALSWELRAATSLARLLRDRDRIGEARDLLAPIYERFTEGFGTADLQAGKKLLDELNSRHRGYRAVCRQEPVARYRHQPGWGRARPSISARRRRTPRLAYWLRASI